MRVIIEMTTVTHPAAWRCGCYLFSYDDSTKTRIIFISLKNKSNIPVDNGSPFKALIIKPTSRFIDITIIMDTVSVL